MNYAHILKFGTKGHSGMHSMSGGHYVSFHKESGVIGFKGNKKGAQAHIKNNRDSSGVSTHTLGMSAGKSVGDNFRSA